MSAGVATDKQRAIADELRANPGRADSEVARLTGCSRALVRRVRTRLGLADVERDAPAPKPRPSRIEGGGGEAAAPSPGREGRPWPKGLDPVFTPAGFADMLESEVRALLEWEGRLNRLLGLLEVSDRARLAARDRVKLHHEVLALARRIQFLYVPVGPCPFCGVEHKASGCHRCAGGGWVAADMVDAFASIEEKQRRSRWWRRHQVEVPG